MADKKLFEQDLKITLGLLDRIAIGIPGQEGCDNMLVSDFINLIRNVGAQTAAITNSDLSAGIWTLTHNLGTFSIELTMYDDERKLVSLDGMLTLTSENELQIDFGGDINGTWTYVLKNWYL